MKSLSVVCPLYNEKDSLRDLYQGIVAEVSRHSNDIELIFVDDGSEDGSFELLKQIQMQDPKVKIVRLRRNFGKSAALSAGFRIARGDLIVTLDADLQDVPSEIGALLEKLDAGCDLVSGWKSNRQDSIVKRLTSRIFNRVTSLLTGVPLHDINCGLKAYRREVIEEIKVYGEMHRFIPVLASYRGFRVAEVRVRHQERRYGQSKYGPGRYLGAFFDLLTVIMLTRYNSKPLHVFGILGVLIFGLGFLIQTYLTVGWFFGRWIEYRPAFMLGILMLLMGVSFIFFGLLAEMIAYSTRRHEEYSVQEVIEAGSDRSKGAPVASLRR